MTEEFCDILDRAFSQDFFSYDGKHYQIPRTHIPARPVEIVDRAVLSLKDAPLPF
jgi:alkanesulfonate monooxygenase SsuD/methylene tetrahydromethanopterin reductase-like flavin-dependent oxidoreductase (luciferase family)